VRPNEIKVIRCADILIRRVRALNLHPIEQAEMFRAIHTVKTITFAQAGFRSLYEPDVAPDEPVEPQESEEPTVAEIKAKATKKASVLARPNAEALRKIAEQNP